ncbi:uncharacterized protein PHACADRAFT_179011 [Phanerochaete carnosa HHB-10118-sp]|uniref:Uncharacterized protein n=1 Tax=Phanerochaete carnosa (strain HHB-10118-sp) TaxID=650164 RepID=K5VS44_PHACS|nr:uncharacterized protein PHACADRAFT_179011 [Phanerochaete carnosa HHB-10118-sp]EKM49600.1 hypothetical protein PHACADRAFT_179011 [Phanerochaete carnosa HHB-10118-sp]
MGFFSSRRPEQIEEPLNHDATVVQVIRSRFYGSKQKGKGRETDTSYTSSIHSEIANNPDNQTSHDLGSLSKAERQPTSPSAVRPRPSNLSLSTEKPRPTTDVITISLAQRLDELATANTQGLLDNDEYRLLRQNLFERLAGGSSIPTETPLVPVAGPPKTPLSAHTRHTLSNFHVQAPRTPSIASKKSFQSTVSGFLKRTTSKKRNSLALDTAGSDASSMRSVPVSPSLTKRTSDSSLRKSRPSTTHDGDPFGSPRRTPVSKIFRSDTRSIRRAPSLPPSSFPTQALSAEARIVQMSAASTLEDDDERLQTAKEIRQEIELVEAEGRRLLDAFNGLELSTLVRRQRAPGRSPLAAASGMISSPIEANACSPTPSLRTGRDPDAMSVVSAHSGFSQTRSPSVKSRMRQLNASASAPVFQPVSLGRKTSMSSVSTRSRSGTAPSHQNSLGRHKLGSTSSVNLTRSTGHLPLPTLSEHEGPYISSPLRSAATTQSSVDNGTQDDDLAGLEAEMADIRKRRTEVTARYEARIEYLRARLKGAELRDKLMKK